jgi:hypothetical protein
MQHQPKGSQQVAMSRAARDAVDVPGSAPWYMVVASTEVGRSADVVWELYCDPHRYPEIAHATERMLHVPEGPMGVGYTYREVGVLGPFKSEDEWTVTEFQPKRRQVHRIDEGSMGLCLEIDVEPTRTGCRVTQGFGVEPRGAMKVMAPVLWPLFMRRLIQDAMERTVANVKAVAEASRT